MRSSVATWGRTSRNQWQVAAASQVAAPAASAEPLARQALRATSAKSATSSARFSHAAPSGCPS